MVCIDSSKFKQHQKDIYNYLKNNCGKENKQICIKIKDLAKLIPSSSNYTRWAVQNLLELNKIELISNSGILGKVYRIN